MLWQSLKPLFVFALVLCQTALGRATSLTRPFAEYEKVKYVVMSAAFDYQTREIKTEIIKNLPNDTMAIVYFSTEYERGVFSEAVQGIDPTRLVFLPIYKSGEAQWPRDSWPNLVIKDGKYQLVDAPYYEGFEPAEEVSSFFDLEIQRQPRHFEHGNLVSNRRGDCFVVSEHFANSMPDSLFMDFYACKKVRRLTFTTGIGHADEVIKFIDDNTLLTNRPELVESLKMDGYQVHLLPVAELPKSLVERGVMPQRSYVNSLLVNGTVFVPIFGLPTDDLAIKTYAALNLKVIPIDSSYVSDYGGGALHCLTMTYPDFEE